MEIDNIIHQLNSKAVFSGQIEYLELSDVQKELLDTQKPWNAFIVYGTLGPKGPNHYFVKDIPGEWYKGIVKGKLEADGWGATQGYNGFRHADADEQQEISAAILISDSLGDHWDRLDKFEGDGYQRILAKYELENGEIGIGYIFALK